MKGVYFNKQYSRYHARIYWDGKNRHLGRFISLEDAVKARQDALEAKRKIKHYFIWSNSLGKC